MKRVAVAAIALFCASSLHAAVADLAIAVKSTRAVEVAEGPASVTFTITNNGPDAASGVFFIDLLPETFIFTGVTSSQGALPCNTNFVDPFNISRCDLLTPLAAGASETITITFKKFGLPPFSFPFGPFSFEHLISVFSAATDLNRSNNDAEIPVFVLPATALVPTLSPPMLALLGLVFAAIALLALRR